MESDYILQKLLNLGYLSDVVIITLATGILALLFLLLYLLIKMYKYNRHMEFRNAMFKKRFGMAAEDFYDYF